MAKNTLKQEPAVRRKRLILSATSKGGCGKSYFDIQLLEWLKSHPSQPRVRGYDPDAENSTLTNYHTDIVVGINVDRTNDMDKPLIALCGDEVDVAVVDGLGSQQRKTFQTWVEDINLFSIKDEVPGGLDITYVHMMEEDMDILEQAAWMLDRVGNQVQWLFVRNLKNAPTTDMWNNSDARKRAMAIGAVEITLPKLWKEGALLVNKLRMPLGRAGTIEGLFVADKQRYLTAQRAINAELEKAAGLLLPAGNT